MSKKKEDAVEAALARMRARQSEAAPAVVKQVDEVKAKHVKGMVWDTAKQRYFPAAAGKTKSKPPKRVPVVPRDFGALAESRLRGASSSASAEFLEGLFATRSEAAP